MTARIPTSEALGTPGVSAQGFTGNIPTEGVEALSRATSQNTKDVMGFADSAIDAVKVGVKIQDERDDYDLQSKFVDFDLEQEKRFDEEKLNAPADPTGFTSKFRGGYDNAAKAFFGKDGENIPPRLRGKYDLALTKRGAQFEKQANDFEIKGREDFHISDLDTRLTGIADRTMADPDPVKMRANIGRSLSLIETARIPAERKQKLMRETASRLEETAVRSRMEQSDKPGNKPEDILADLRNVGKSGGRAGGDGVSETGVEFIKDIEGFEPEAKWDVRQFSAGHGSKVGKGEKLTEEEADARLREDLAPITKHIASKVTVPLSQQQMDGLASFAYNLGTDDFDKLVADINSGDFEKVADRMETFDKAAVGPGGALVPYGNLPARRRKEAEMVRDGVGAPVGEVQVAELKPVGEGSDAMEMTEKAEPVYRYLKPGDRFTLMNIVRMRGRAEVENRIENDIANLRLTGNAERDENGQTSLERGSQFLTQSKQAQLREDWKEAEFEHKAVAGLRDMSPADFENRQKQVAEGLDDGEDTAAKVKATRKMETEWKKVLKLRAYDPAESVKGSDELKAAADVITKGKKDGSLNQQQMFAVAVEARIESQRKRGISATEQRILTRAEAAKLLNMGDPRTVTDTRLLRDSYNAARIKAEKLYGKRYAARALADAMSFQKHNPETRNIAFGVQRNEQKNIPIPEADRQRVEAQVEAERAAGVFTPPDEPAPTKPKADLGALDRDPKKGGTRKKEPSPKEIEMFRKMPSRWGYFAELYGEERAVKELGPKPAPKSDGKAKPGEKSPKGVDAAP